VNKNVSTANLEHFPDIFVDKLIVVALFWAIKRESWHSLIFTATINSCMSQTNQIKQGVYDYCRTMLGDGMVDVELDPVHYETALNRALSVFRQRSDNSVEESYIFLNLQPDVNEYTLPQEIQQIRQIFRRSVGSRTGGGTGGTVFEPFNLAYSNTYLLSSTNMGGLYTNVLEQKKV